MRHKITNKGQEERRGWVGLGSPACSPGAGRGPGLPGDCRGSRASRGDAGPWPLTGCAGAARPSSVPAFVRWTRRGTPSKQGVERRSLWSPALRACSAGSLKAGTQAPCSLSRCLPPGPHWVCRAHPVFRDETQPRPHQGHLSRGPWLDCDPGAP